MPDDENRNRDTADELTLRALCAELTEERDRLDREIDAIGAVLAASRSGGIFTSRVVSMLAAAVREHNS